jgi:hypothetical protein
VAVTLIFTGAFPFWAKATKKPASPVIQEVLSLQREAEDTIRTLEDIIRVSVRPGPYEGSRVAYRTPAPTEETFDDSSYKSCLEDCERGFSSEDEDEQLLLVNCKMQCMAQYNRRIKKLKERFYSKPLE